MESAIGLKFDSPSDWSQLCSEAGFVVEFCEVSEMKEIEPSLEERLKMLEVAIPRGIFKRCMLKDTDVKDPELRKLDVVMRLCILYLY